MDFHIEKFAPRVHVRDQNSAGLRLACIDRPVLPKINHVNDLFNYNLMSRAYRYYLAALCVMTFGVLMAADHYPDGFDWAYTVVSALASQKHNPTGSFWFSGSLSLSMLLLWPYVTAVKQGLPATHPTATRLSVLGIRLGLLSGMLLGIERLLIYDLSHLIDKAHEIIALFTFLGLYVGILILLVVIMQRHRYYMVPVLLVAMPLLAICLSLLWLYLGQRDLGWVDVQWREKGVPIWLSFAFWQWLGIGFLWAGMALLNAHKEQNTMPP